MEASVLKDSGGIPYKYPNRTCKECIRYPCFDGINNLSCDFAKYGCRKYTD
jgi:hypothetical protein